MSSDLSGLTSRVHVLPDRGPHSRLAALERAPLFKGARPSLLRDLAFRAREIRFRRRERLLEQGAPLDSLYLIASGRVKITILGYAGQEIIVRLVGPGEVAAGLSQSTSSSPLGVEALEPGIALVWAEAVVSKILDCAPVVRGNALRIVAERLRSMEDRFQELCSERVPVRLARTLVRLLGQIGRPAPGGTIIALSREELAMMIGTTLFTVSRILSRWETSGIVVGRRESVLIADLPALSSVAASDGD